MKKIFLLFVLASFFVEKSNSQITKGYWLAGGNGSFSVERTTAAGSFPNKSTNILVNAGVGFFPINKLAFGLRPLFSYAKASAATNKYYTYGLSPFARYYFLKPEKIVNLFAETSYSFEYTVQRQTGNNGTSRGNSFLVMAGPVIFFNSSIGIEFAFGYLINTQPNFGEVYNRSQLKIGFQYHLIKDKEK